MARILHILTSPRAEGTPRLVLDWLALPGHEQGVAFLTGEPADLLAEFRHAARWLSVASVLPRGPVKFARILRAAARWTREFRPDVVIAWPTGFAPWIFLGVRAARSSAGLLSHGGNPPAQRWFPRYVHTWACLWIAAACGGRVVACSRYVQQSFRRIPLVPARVVSFAYNSLCGEAVARRAAAVRARRERDSVRPFRAIMVATLEAHKDHATLLHAARRLHEQAVACEIWIVGGGSLDAELKSCARALGVGHLVTFWGARPDVPELLGAADVFVLSTTAQEGRPGVILEALAAGLPIIASDVAPLREVLENGRWGTLVPPADPAALADALATAAASRTGHDERAVAGRREFATAFTPARMMSDYLRVAGLRVASH